MSSTGTPLSHAAHYGQPGTIALLLQHGASTRERNESGRIPLHTAAKSGNEEALKLLALHNNGADLELMDRKRKTAILIAAGMGFAKCVEVLLECGARVDVPDITGRTALIGAAQFGYHDVVEVLIKAKASKKIKDNRGCTALDVAQACGHKRTVEVLRRSIFGFRY